MLRVSHFMREFSHPGTDRKTATDINRALENTITIARNEWKYVAEVETDFNLPLVPCLPGEMNQVFLNLLINAAHAVEDAVKTADGGKGRIHSTPDLRSFFSTKAVGKGTGQGLAIAHNVVVEKHCGTLKFETGVNKGTPFIIQLPLGRGDRDG